MIDDLISIIIPIYNAEPYIAECMECVLSQTYGNIEIILIDDGSEDESAQLCKGYLEKDDRIKYFHKKNGGAASARNIGIKQAQGKFLYFMDVDDVLEKNAIEKLYNAFQVHLVDFVIGNVKHISIYGREELEWTIEDRLFADRDAIRNLVYAFADDMKSNKMLYSAWGKLYRSDIIKEEHLYYNERMHTHEDNVFVIAYLSYCNSAYYVGDCLYIYRHYQLDDKKSYSETGWLLGPLDFRYIVKEVRKILPNEGEDEQAVGNFYSEYAILTMFHCIRQVKIHSIHDLKMLYSIIYRIVKEQKETRRAIAYYVQKHDDNVRIIPFFIKKGWVVLIIITFKLQILNLEKKNRKHRVRVGGC